MSGRERLGGASSTRRPFAERLPHPHRRTAWFVAVAVPLLITAASRLLVSSIPPATTLFVTLLVVVTVALVGGERPALAAVAVGLLAQEAFFGFPYGSLNNHQPAQISVLIVFVVIGAGIGMLVDELVRLTNEQAALRRIATLAARGIPGADLFSAVAQEVAALLAVESAIVARVELDAAPSPSSPPAAHAPMTSFPGSAGRSNRSERSRASCELVNQRVPMTTRTPLLR